MNNATSPRTFPLALPLYDVLSYITPGGIFLLAVFLFELWARFGVPTLPVVTPFKTPFLAAAALVYSENLGASWIGATLFGLALLACSYLLGHLFASVSSLVLERILVFRGYGYPYASMLRIRRDLYRAQSHSGGFYRGIFFWANLTLIGGLLRLAHEAQLVSPVPWFTYPLAPVSTAVLLIGLLVKSVTTIERTTPIRRVTRRHRALRGVVALLQFFLKHPFAWGYDFVAAIVGRLLDTRQAFSAQFRQRYVDVFFTVTGFSSSRAGTNNFWLPYCHVITNSQAFAAALTNWLTLYGFARNLSTALYFFFLYAFIWLGAHTLVLSQVYPWPKSILFFFAITALLASLTLLIRYYYLYACYQTKFLFRAFVYLGTTGAGHSQAPTAGDEPR